MDEQTPAVGPQQNWTVFGLPRSHWHCQLDTFDWASVAPQKLKLAVERFVNDVNGGGSPHMVLHGAPGIGKSHIGVGIYRSVAAVVGTELALWLSVPVFCETVKRSYAPGVPDPWRDVAAARRLVVLDDLFGRELTSHEKDQIITRLLDTVYQNGAALVVTMNQTLDELAQRLPAHEISRLLAGSLAVPVVGKKDWRR